jgi:hypothetical protein
VWWVGIVDWMTGSWSTEVRFLERPGLSVLRITQPCIEWEAVGLSRDNVAGAWSTLLSSICSNVSQPSGARGPLGMFICLRHIRFRIEKWGYSKISLNLSLGYVIYCVWIWNYRKIERWSFDANVNLKSLRKCSFSNFIEANAAPLSLAKTLSNPLL